MRRLIINADDFGLTRGVNRAIFEAHRHGVVTSTTLMANASAFDDAVALSQTCPELSVGCHVVLVDGEPVLPRNQVGSLLGNDGNFRQSLTSFYLAAFAGRLREEQVESEAAAQIQKLQSAGLRVSHLDTHKHTHMLPMVLRPILRAARRCGVRAVRNPFEPAGWSLLRTHPSLWKRWLEVRTLRVFERQFRSTVQAADIATTDAACGVVVTGMLNRELFEDSVQAGRDGISEFVCHPGYNDEDLGAVRTRLRGSREQEFSILTDPTTHAWLVAQGFQLASYSEV